MDHTMRRKVLQKYYQMDSALQVILSYLIMLQKEPSGEDYNCRKKKNVTTIEILSHEEVIELKEMYENLSYTDFNSEKLDVPPLRK